MHMMEILRPVLKQVIFTTAILLTIMQPGHSVVVINEINYDELDQTFEGRGSPGYEFVELYDGGSGNTPLDGLVIIRLNAYGSHTAAFDLSGRETDHNGFFLIGGVYLLNRDMDQPGLMHNEGGAIILYNVASGSTENFINTYSVTSMLATIEDIVIWEEPDGVSDDWWYDVVSLNVTTPPMKLLDDDGFDHTNDLSLSRCSCCETKNLTVFTRHYITPKMPNIYCPDCQTHAKYRTVGVPMIIRHVHCHKITVQQRLPVTAKLRAANMADQAPGITMPPTTLPYTTEPMTTTPETTTEPTTSEAQTTTPGITCPTLPDDTTVLDESTVQPTTLHSTTVTQQYQTTTICLQYTAQEGFTTTNPSTQMPVTTGEDATTTSDPPTTAVFGCGPPPVVPNAWIEAWSGNLMLEGGTAMYRCNYGFSYMEGNPNITCQANLTWTQPPSCLRDCSSEPSIINATVVSTSVSNVSAHQSSVNIKCDPGYVLKTDSHVSCDSGDWHMGVPTCEALIDSSNGSKPQSLLASLIDTSDDSSSADAEAVDELFTIEWGKWIEWTACTSSCGKGFRLRMRMCFPLDYNCSENAIGVGSCFERECPIDGQWLEWGPWSNCSVTCGSGTISRQRWCKGPFHGGRDCDGKDVDRDFCEMSECPNANRGQPKPKPLSEGYTKADERPSAQTMAAIAISMVSIEVFAMLMMDANPYIIYQWFKKIMKQIKKKKDAKSQDGLTTPVTRLNPDSP